MVEPQTRTRLERSSTPHEQGYDFNILEEFMGLTTRRRLLLCEQLFMEGPDFFTGTVNLLWPQASNKDVRKLESFLVLLRETYFKKDGRYRMPDLPETSNANVA